MPVRDTVGPFVPLSITFELIAAIDICYIFKNGSPHGDQSWGNPDDMVDEG